MLVSNACGLNGLGQEVQPTPLLHLQRGERTIPMRPYIHGPPETGRCATQSRWHASLNQSSTPEHSRHKAPGLSAARFAPPTMAKFEGWPGCRTLWQARLERLKLGPFQKMTGKKIRGRSPLQFPDSGIPKRRILVRLDRGSGEPRLTRTPHVANDLGLKQNVTRNGHQIFLG